MTRPVTLVVNPAARKGATLRMIDPVTDILRAHGWRVDVVVTRSAATGSTGGWPRAPSSAAASWRRCPRGVGTTSSARSGARATCDAPRAVPSSLVYAYGGARTLVHALPRPLTLVVDGVTHEFTGWYVAIGNSGRFGAGMRVNPDASMSDGLLDVTVVTDIPRWRYPAMLPRLFRGTHVDGVRVRALRRRDIRVITPHVGDVYADGDLLEASPTTFRALPDALRVLVPAP